MENKIIITNLLRSGWHSNLDMIKACNTSSEDRLFRQLREKKYFENIGYTLEEKYVGWKKFFRLVKKA